MVQATSLNQPVEGQHDVTAAHHCGVSDQSIIGPPLTLFGKIQERLGHFEEHLYVPAPFVGLDDFLISHVCVG